MQELSFKKMSTPKMATLTRENGGFFLFSHEFRDTLSPLHLALLNQFRYDKSNIKGIPPHFQNISTAFSALSLPPP